jgi:hypothetical protein
MRPNNYKYGGVEVPLIVVAGLERDFRSKAHEMHGVAGTIRWEVI